LDEVQSSKVMASILRNDHVIPSNLSLQARCAWWRGGRREHRCTESPHLRV